MKYKIRAIGNWCFVEPIKVETGIEAIDNMNKDRPSKAVVVSVGDGELCKASGLKDNATVIIRKHAVDTVEIDGEEYHPIHVNEIFGEILNV